jgi:hypothetical protein
LVANALVGGWGKVERYPKARGEAEAVVEQPIAARDGRAVLAFLLVQLHDALALVEDNHLALAAPSNSEGGGACCVRGLCAATRRLGGVRWGWIALGWRCERRGGAAAGYVLELGVAEEMLPG